MTPGSGVLRPAFSILSRSFFIGEVSRRTAEGLPQRLAKNREALLADAIACAGASLVADAIGPGDPFFTLPPQSPRGAGERAAALPWCRAIETARVRFREAEALRGGNEIALEWEGRLLASLGREGEAHGLFLRLLRRAKTSRGRLGAWLGVASLALRRGSVEAAVRHFRAAIDLEPTHPIAWLRLGEALLLLPDAEEAAEAFRRLEGVLAERPGLLAVVQEAIAASRGSARRALADPRGPLELLRRAAPTVFEGIGLAEGSFEEDPGAPRRRVLAIPPLVAATASARDAGAGRRVVRIACRALGFPSGAVLAARGDGPWRREASWCPGAKAACGTAFEEVARGIGRLADERPIVRRPDDPWAAGPRRGPITVLAVGLRCAGDGTRTVLLASPHVVYPSEEEIAFLRACAIALRSRPPADAVFPTALSEIERAEGLLEGVPLRLAARAVRLLDAEEGGGPIRLRERVGRAFGPAEDRADLRGTLVEEAARGRTVFAAGERSRLLFAGAACGLALPVEFEGRVVGVLAVESRRRDLGREDGARLRVFAQSLAWRLRASQFADFVRDRSGEPIAVSEPGARLRPLLAPLARAARTSSTVVLRGETGCGKEVFARLVHFESARRAGPFLPLAGGALPALLAEGELFGESRGAFTGAVRDRPGRFEAARGGTLFLDEVGDLPLDVQAKLLRAIESGSVRRVGESAWREVDLRLVAATRFDLAERARRGEFREDLYHRFGRLVFEIPPLRERREEIPALVDCLVERAVASAGAPRRRFSEDALAILWRQDWPGNFRALENFVRRCLLLAREDPIPGSEVRDLARRSGLSMRERVLSTGVGVASEIAMALETAARERLPRVARAAALLGWHPDTVSRRARALGLR